MQRRAYVRFESWNQEGKTAREGLPSTVGMKSRGPFQHLGRRTSALVRSGKNAGPNWRSTKVVQLHQRLKRSQLGKLPGEVDAARWNVGENKTSQEDGMVDWKIEAAIYPNKEIWIHGGVQEVEQLHTDGDEQPMEDCAKLRNVKKVTEAAELNRNGLSRRWTPGMWREEIRVKRYKLESNVGEGWPACWEPFRLNREGRASGKEAKKRKKVLRQIKNVMRNLNQLENGEEYAHKLSWNACIWHEFVGLTFFGQWTHLLVQSRNEQEHATIV